MKFTKYFLFTALSIFSACSLPDEYQIWHYAKYWFNVMDLQSGEVTHLFDAEYGNYYGDPPLLFPFNEQDSLRFVKVREYESPTVVNVKGTELRKLAQSVDGTDNMAFVSDKRFMVYASDKNLFIVPVSGGAPKQLTSDSYNDFAPAFSPDGSHIAFIRADSNSSVLKRLALTDTASATVHNLCEMKSYYTPAPAFHPDNQRIFFYLISKDTSVTSGLYSIRTDGTDKHLWFAGNFYSSNIAFDTDGNVVFSFLKHIYVLNDADGSVTDLGEVLDNGYDVVRLVVFGQRIVFATGHNHGRILSIYSDGSGLQSLAVGDQPNLFNDGKKMVFLGVKWFQKEE